MSPLVDSIAPRLIVGCGYLGRRVASLWLNRGYRILALTRHRADELRQRGIEPITGDVLVPESLRSLSTASTVLYAVGMDRAGGKAGGEVRGSPQKSMREVYVTGLRHVLDTLPVCDRFIYISSTSVYGQTDGSWVTEASVTQPAEESGKVILEAEQLLRERRPDAIILRFAGIYGPDRLLRRQPILKGDPLVGDAEKWLNLIHVDDGAKAVLETESCGVPGETYNIADTSPVSRRDFYTLLAELLHAPAARFDQKVEQGGVNRRIDTTKFGSLGWSPSFPSYREGLTAATQESTM